MARENQGLQIALIVFFMLAILLGVSTYWCYRLYEESSVKASDNLAKLEKATKLAAKNEEDVNELKRLIGLAKTEKVETLKDTTFKADMNKYGAGYAEVPNAYRPLMEKMQQTIDEKNAALALSDAKVQKLEEDFRIREASKQPQIDEFKQAAETANKDLSDERAKFNGDRDRLTQDEAKIQSDLEKSRKDAEAALAKSDKQLQDAVAKMQKLGTVNTKLADEQAKILAGKFDASQGQVRWVNQREGTVWIDLGKADNLHRQVTFSVYPSNAAEMSAVAKKASIEVTQVLGDHLAEARFYDDNLTDPIVPGDQIYTPLWTPGEKRHFALAGYMDINGDGKNDLQAVKDMIAINGGVVDCYIDDKGKLVGDVTINTRYLVLGEAPTEKGEPAAISAFTKLRNEAERYGVQKVQLADLLQRVGWRNQTATVRYGRGSNPKDFAPKPPEGLQKKSTGNVSEVFTPRTAPPAPSNSYYKFSM